MGFGKFLKKAAGFVLPNLGFVGGAANGLIQGGGLSGALKGGIGSAIQTAASLGGGPLSSALGVSSSLGGALAGAGGGIANSLINKTNPVTGALSGAAGGYFSNGGISDIGGLFGTAAGTPLSNGAIGATQGSGLLGAATRGLSDIGSALRIGTGGGGSSYGGGTSYGNIGTALLGGLNSMNANDKAEKALLESQRNAMGVLQPYLASGAAANSRLSDLLGTSGNSSADGYGSLNDPFTADDLQNDPGYQFQLKQGQQALDRQQAARGGYYSGAALKDALAYGTGLADSTFKDAAARDAANKAQLYGMYSGQAGAGQSAAGAAGNIYDNVGNARANASISSSNIFNNTLTSLLNGSGAKRFLGYGQNGQPIYA